MAAPRPKHTPRDRTLEAELKFKLSGAAAQAQLRRHLHELEAKLDGAYDEENLRFWRTGKPPPVSLRLRIIDGGTGGILTAKGPARFLRGIKIREETEVEVSDAQALRDMLAYLGYEVAFTYHKHRETWKLPSIAVFLDVLDFGFFVELEGEVDLLEPTAKELGLNPRSALKSSYSAMARKHQAGAKGRALAG